MTQGSVAEDPLVHIGYHKTGTTSLQSSVFASEEAGFTSPWNRGEVIRDLVMPGPLSFSAAEVRARYRPAVEAARDRGLLPVLSHERLSGYPASGGFDGGQLADRIAAVFPSAKVLMVIREQKSLLRSWYAQFVRDGGALPFHAYVRAFPPTTEFRRPLFSYEFYEFDRLIRHYRSVLADGNLLVLPFELLVHDPGEFLARLCAHVDLPPVGRILPTRNPGLPPTAVALRRLVHRAFYANQLHTGPVLDSPGLVWLGYRVAGALTRLAPDFVQRRLDRRLRSQVEEAVGDRYRESNRRTSELIGFDLGTFGYDCEPIEGGRAVARVAG